MKLIDCYYFAFKEYRKTTENNKDCQRDRQFFTKNGIDLDKFVVKKYLCHINSDWIQTIEDSLEFVQNAVAQERQFIRTDGDVVPIEKVRRVSRDSVEHLAKHSNFITHVKENIEDTVPDKLYITERLSDYAVYENRVLYKLLCYLRDFVELKLSNIEKLRKTYICDLYAKKKKSNKYRTTEFELVFHDENYNNEYPLADSNDENLISRIKDIAQITNMLLNTNLMIEVSKAPLVRDPITKTNVLKMNNDFVHSLALYEYLVGYTQKGYEEQEVVKEYHPYSSIVSDELAEVSSCLTFLTYKFGNEIEEQLELNYQSELKRIEEEENIKLQNKIKRLKKRVFESGESIEEYMVMLEERNNALEQDSLELKKCEKVIDELKNNVANLNKEISEQKDSILRLEDTIKQKEEEINELNIKHKNEIEELNENHKNEINQINQSHVNEINELNESHSDQIKQLNEMHEQELEDTRNDCYKEFSDEIDDLKKDIDDLNINISIKEEEYKNQISLIERDYEGRIDKINQDNDSLNKQVLEVEKNISELSDELAFKKAELDCQMAVNGNLNVSKELTKEEEFKQLERNYKLYTKFYKKQWALTKKEIRKELLWKKEEKTKNKKLKKEETKLDNSNNVLNKPIEEEQNKEVDDATLNDNNE